MTRLSDASHHPFANGTEGLAWQACWCDLCAHDHEMHTPDGCAGCPLLLASLIGEWPEGWLPEPDDGQFFLPSRLICTKFTPCLDCGGDPGAEERAARVAEVTAYWEAAS